VAPTWVGRHQLRRSRGTASFVPCAA
jgi:hypothetical protein